MALRTRYPGAHPFADDDLARKIFFGRDGEKIDLANQIMVNRLVVVFARSGVGKTSLLNAGVAQLLRDNDFLPVMVRLNDVKLGPLNSLYEAISQEANRQEIQYGAGMQETLWHFFKTSQFWRKDTLLTPVLIMDQFEELFTLQTPELREALILQLSYLVRGVKPPGMETHEGDVTTSRLDAPADVRTVISIREDYLASLEEIAERIPQILDNRFRLLPLSIEAAKEAILYPAAVKDQILSTKRFSYDIETVNLILDFLARRSAGGVTKQVSQIEPFQLQLVCQRVEEKVAEKQNQIAENLNEEDLKVTMEDLGGEEGLKAILRDFYRRQLYALPTWRIRRSVRRLCQEYLISPEGRRLSMDEKEITRLFKLDSKILESLVDNRLLRSDQRVDTTYYELSHDTLIAPISEAWQSQGQVFGIILGVGGHLARIVGVLIAVAFTAAIPMMIAGGLSTLWGSVVTGLAAVGFLMMGIFSGLALIVGGHLALRKGEDWMRRFRYLVVPKKRTGLLNLTQRIIASAVATSWIFTVLGLLILGSCVAMCAA